MSLSHENLLELMSLADGELDGAERERVEQLVASNVEAQRIVESLRGPTVGAWLAETMDRTAATSGADGIADAVMAAVAGPARGSQRVANGVGAVTSIAQAPSRRSNRLQIAMTSVGAVLALAAGVALYAREKSDHLDQHAPIASVNPPPADSIPPASLAQQGGVEVNEIDAPTRGVSVFEIPVGAAAAAAKPSGASSVVIWVDDDPGSK